MKNNIWQKLGAKGGKATAKKYGKEHYRKLAKKSWRARRQAKPKTDRDVVMAVSDNQGTE